MVIRISSGDFEASTAVELLARQKEKDQLLQPVLLIFAKRRVDRQVAGTVLPRVCAGERLLPDPLIAQKPFDR